MSGSVSPPSDRAKWIVELRRANEQQEDALAPTYDAEWGEVGGHASSVRGEVPLCSSGRRKGARRGMRHRQVPATW
jgi:hypothetical protein